MMDKNKRSLWAVIVMSDFNSLHTSLETANTAAKDYFDSLSGRDMVNITCDEVGKPFDAACCYDYGGATCLVMTERVMHANVLSLRHLRKGLSMLEASAVGARKFLVERLQTILDGKTPEPGSIKRSSGSKEFSDISKFSCASLKEILQKRGVRKTGSREELECLCAKYADSTKEVDPCDRLENFTSGIY
jgi:hypothetical protein